MRAFVKGVMVLTKRLNFFFFQWPKADQVRNEYSPQLSKLLYNCKLKNKENIEGLSEDRGLADFPKTFRASLFNEDLSNEPNFIRIHLAGQYL
jgi:hypothetical protein